MKHVDFSNEGFEINEEPNWRKGMGNLISSELNTWIKTKKLLVNLLLWPIIVNGLLLTLLTAVPEDQTNFETALGIFTLFTLSGSSIGVIVLMQDAIVGEKQTGTAAWILSKPVSRNSFILSKIIVNAILSIITMIIIPGVIARFILSAWDYNIGFLDLIFGLTLLTINLLFYLTLTVSLGTFFDTRAPVIGIPIAFLMGQQFLSTISQDIFYITICYWK